MLKTSRFSLMLIMTALSWTQLASAENLDSAKQSAQIQWWNHFEKAHSSNEAKRPLLVFLSVDGCFYCKQMQKTTFLDPAVIKTVENRFVPVAIDGAKYPKLVRHLKIRSYPTTLLISPELKVLASMNGYQSASQLQRQLNKVKVRTVADRSDSDLR